MKRKKKKVSIDGEVSQKDNPRAIRFEAGFFKDPDSKVEGPRPSTQFRATGDREQR